MHRESLAATDATISGSAVAPPVLPVPRECRRSRGRAPVHNGDVHHDCGTGPAAQCEQVLHVVGIAERRQGVPRSSTSDSVRQLRRAMADALTWEDLFTVAQNIWAHPVVDSRDAAASERTRLYKAYVQAVDRLWRRGATRRNRSRGARMGGIAA